MAIVPRDAKGKVAFATAHSPVWTANATAIGTTAPDVAAMDALTTAAQTALETQQSAHDAAKSATNAANIALGALDASIASIISQIKGKAKVAGDGVYSLANLPPPAMPRPVHELGMPMGMTASIDGNGGLTLKWKCTNPHGAIGVVYQIWRRDTADGEFVYIGGTGAKEYLDTTIPRGVSGVTYMLQAVRSNAVGPWVQFNVNFSTSASGTGKGTVTASVTKIAA